MTVTVSYGNYSQLHCKHGKVEAAYIECGNGAEAKQVSQVNLFELGQLTLNVGMVLGQCK